jgi:hypothetical protein
MQLKESAAGDCLYLCEGKSQRRYLICIEHYWKLRIRGQCHFSIPQRECRSGFFGNLWFKIIADWSKYLRQKKPQLISKFREKGQCDKYF